MPQVELDDDLYEYFRRHELLTGECLSDHLRILLRARPKRDLTRPGTPRPGTDLAEFLAILTEVHRKFPDRFARIADVRGRTRIYFAQSAGEIERSGTCTAPVEISGTGWWVFSNSGTILKREILQKVFRAIGCSSEDCRKWLSQFDGSEAPLDPWQLLEEGDADPLKI